MLAPILQMGRARAEDRRGVESGDACPWDWEGSMESGTGSKACSSLQGARELWEEQGQRAEFR